MNLSEMLAQNASMYPNEIALVELRPSRNFRTEITWKEFDEEANRIANALISRGIKKGDKVIHWVMNSIDWLTAYFGIVRTGAWTVPLNFRFTGSDLEYCASIAEAKAIILGEEFAERVEDSRQKLSSIKDFLFIGRDLPERMESLEKIASQSSPEPAGVHLDMEDACGLYFTSGTTGMPKPILLTHKNMESAAISENRHHFITHEDTFILIPPLYHAGGKMHWFGSLIVGGKAVILAEMSPKNILDAVHNEKGTIVFLLVPWTLDILRALDSGELRKDDYNLSCWRLMHMGAQPIPPSVVRRWKEYFPDMQYDTSYGLSESTGPGCVHLGIENEYKVGAIGKAGLNWETRIVDDNGKDVSPGEAGELLVKGAGVMKEYYKNPEKTAETIKDGWLYTGDVARIDEDGFIYLVDRKKDVIITGGENIYPVEVEDTIRNYPGIFDVAVIGVPDERLGEIAAAIIEPNPDTALNEEEISKFCEENLPRYKRPRRIYFDKVPRNPTGKLEKPKLREKYSGQKESFKLQ